MGNYDLSKYSPYVECVTMAYSAGNKSGQSPAEISIPEMGTLTARAELIKRQNPNQNRSVLGWGGCLLGLWGPIKGTTLVPGLFWAQRQTQLPFGVSWHSFWQIPLCSPLCSCFIGMNQQGWYAWMGWLNRTWREAVLSQVPPKHPGKAQLLWWLCLYPICFWIWGLWKYLVDAEELLWLCYLFLLSGEDNITVDSLVISLRQNLQLSSA